MNNMAMRDDFGLPSPIKAFERPRALSREMTIQQALHWAFAVEHAQIDFDLLGAKEFDRCGVDIIWIMQQQNRLGCRVDGGGNSDPHVDAQIIAAAVEAIPVEHGGRRMAMTMAELARTRSAPDWGDNEKLACVRSGYEDKERTGSLWVWRTRQRKTRQQRGDICTVSYTGTAKMIAEKRRAYLAWYGALLHLLWQLGRGGVLSHIRLVDGLPPQSPWKSS